MGGVRRMHTRLKSHFDGTNRQWDEFECVRATTDCSCSQGSCTEAKYAGIMTVILSRIDLTTIIVQRLSRVTQPRLIPYKSCKLEHTSHSHIQWQTSLSARLS